MRPSLMSIACALALLAGCASNTIVPTYNTSDPNLQVGGKRPQDSPPQVENAGSFCLQVEEKWHTDGKTPDGQALWTRDTFRKVVPCT
ncbi:MAG: hypothetical protein IT495_05485 [Gammaproteobacteria bacterium]|nr:hypothetical protein [Gammaproteobacteria bacterium]